MPTPHVCSEDCIVLNRDSRFVCRVTGQCYHQYINTNPFYTDRDPEMPSFAVAASPKSNATTTRRRKGQSKKINKRPKPNLTKEAINKQILKIFMLLLFSNKRHGVEEDDKSCRQNETKKVSNKHHRKRRKLDKAVVTNDGKTKIISDVERIVYFCHKKRPFLKIEPLILGAMYLMQHGKKLDSINIPKHDVLYLYLPSISDLPRFNIRKNVVRIGSNTIIRCARESV